MRGTALSNYRRLVGELGGDPAELLRAAGIRAQDIDQFDVFIPLRGVITAVESAATATKTPDFGRRLAQLQGIEILGPVGVAARTAGCVADALAIFENFMAAYSPALSIVIKPLDDKAYSFLDFQVLLEPLSSIPQSIELSLGVTLGVLRLLLGADYAPVAAHLPHQALCAEDDYRRYFGCPTYFGEPTTGFTLRTADLTRRLNADRIAHVAVVRYLNTVTQRDASTAQSVRTLVRQLLPTGTVTLELIAAQLNFHPKSLQRRLSAEGLTFGGLLEEVRRGVAERYLRDTDMTLLHLSRELGYSEQSVLTRACQRWFGASPAAYRRSMRRSSTDTRSVAKGPDE